MTTSTKALYIMRPQPLGMEAPESMPVIMWGQGTPDGDAEPWKSAQKGSKYIQVDGTDDHAHEFIKVDEGNDDNDWMYCVVSTLGSAIGNTSGSAKWV